MGIEKGIYRRLLLYATDGYTYTCITHLHRRLLCFPLCRGRSSRWQFSSDKLTEELNANQVKWADEYDGYGEHYYEYNHGHHEPEKGYPAPAYHEPAKGYSEPAPVYERGPAPPKYWNHTPKNKNKNCNIDDHCYLNSDSPVLPLLVLSLSPPPKTFAGHAFSNQHIVFVCLIWFTPSADDLFAHPYRINCW